jgi:predicted small lipoprotein YifL
MRSSRSFAVLTTVAFATAACGGEGPATFQPIPAGNLSSTFHRPAESATGEDDASAKAQREGKARLNQQLIKAAWDNDLRRPPRSHCQRRRG